MKEVIFICIAILIMAGCTTKVENNFFYCISYDEKGNCIEWAEMDADPRIDNEQNIDKDVVAVSDEDKIVENETDILADEDIINADSDTILDSDSNEIFSDEDNFVDNCSIVVDKNQETAKGDYSSGADISNPATVLTVDLLSTEFSCFILLSSTSIADLDGLSIETTVFPVVNKIITHKGKECYFSAKFDSGNSLGINIDEVSTLKPVIDLRFRRKL